MKTIPLLLLDAKAKGTTSMCSILRLTTRRNVDYGFTGLNRDVVFNDGGGALTYKARRGFTPSKTSANESLGVDNADLVGLLADLLADGITAELIHAGQLNGATVHLMQVDYSDTSKGYESMLFGTIGEITLQGGEYTAEFRSLTQQLKQQIIEAFSLTCRAQFGDDRCKIDAEARFEDGAVTAVGAVGAENDLQFSDTSMTQAEGFFAPGRIVWLTGDNEGAESDVDTFEHDGVLGGIFTLLMPLFYPIAVTDTYKVRDDCAKTLVACKAHNNVLNMRAEPYTPIGDAAQVSTPGAQLGQPGGAGSSGNGTLPL